MEVCMCVHLAAQHLNFLPAFKESLLVGVDGVWKLKTPENSFLPFLGNLMWA